MLCHCERLLQTLTTLFIGFVCLWGADASAYSRTLVKVGAYDFPPYYSSSARNSEEAGLLNLAMHRLNIIQNKYYFEIVSTSTNRRSTMFHQQKFDLLFFEDPDWGWNEIDYTFTPLPIHDGEIYITNKTKPYVDIKSIQLKKLTLAGVQGFHYQLGEGRKNVFPSAENHIAVYGHESVLRMVASSRAVMGLVPKSYYYAQKKDLEEVTKQLKPSTEMDTEYKLGILRRRKAPISQSELQRIADLLMSDPPFKKAVESLHLHDAKKNR